IARIALPDAARRDRGCLLHPSSTDGALRALAALLGGEARGGVGVVGAIERVRVFAPLPDAVYALATRATTRGCASHELKGRVALFDDCGRLVATIEGARFER